MPGTQRPRGSARRADPLVVGGTSEVPGGVEMTPGVRSFLVGFMLGVVACVGFITYYGDLGGNWLIAMGQKMKAAQTEDGYQARRH